MASRCQLCLTYVCTLYRIGTRLYIVHQYTLIGRSVRRICERMDIWPGSAHGQPNRTRTRPVSGRFRIRSSMVSTDWHTGLLYARFTSVVALPTVRFGTPPPPDHSTWETCFLQAGGGGCRTQQSYHNSLFHTYDTTSALSACVIPKRIVRLLSTNFVVTHAVCVQPYKRIHLNGFDVNGEREEIVCRLW